MHFEIYKSGQTTADWRWRLVSANGQVLADSAQSYPQKADCQRSIYAVKAASVLTPIREL